ATGTGNCWGLGSSTTNQPLYTNGIIVRGGVGAGVAFSPSGMNAVTDGTSNTMMIAEAGLATSHYSPPPNDLDALEGAPANWGPPPHGWMLTGYYGGWSNWGVTRCSMNGPFRDEPYPPNWRALWQMLGSAHPGGINAVFADGSVRMYNFGTPNAILQVLVRKNDGLVVDLSSF